MRVGKTWALKGFALGPMTLRPFAGERLMAVRVEAPAGARAPAHSHPHEQMTLVVSGRLRFRVGEEWREVGPMEVVHIPPGMEHEAEVLEEAVFFDLFHPVREDFLRRVEEG
ncbi:cupin domain-containing protein [Thermus thalpophilus]|uniref:cupin domain-containing protein n=1 Tax=Thermus thalpophilus TaxID=2908147 RepID=UPI001FA98843|nr:cupin domain-containing protein [Thermus thalpophilus]